VVTLQDKKIKKKLNLLHKFNLKKILNSAHTLVISLSILITILIIFNYHIMNVNRTYMFNGRGEFVSIQNGAISLNHDVHLFIGSDLTYNHDEDFVVIEYTFGYYLPRGLDMMPLLVQRGADDLGFSLRGLIEQGSMFNLVEPYQNKIFFNRESMNRLDNGLYFIIEAITIDGIEIFDKISMDISRLSR